jgi:hypothetical protein
MGERLTGGWVDALTIVCSAAFGLLCILIAFAAVAQLTGLPFSDDFEGDLSGWPSSGESITIGTTRAASGTHSAQSLIVNGDFDSGNINRAWGDASRVCTSGCFDCDETTECPGGATPDLTFEFELYLDQTDWSDPGADRKVLQLGIFDDFGALHGDEFSHLRHMVAYLSLITFDKDSDGQNDELVFNSFRRNDNNGNNIGDVFDGTGAQVSTLPHDQWNSIRVHVVLNTRGNSDGIYTMWINDVQVENRSDMNWIGGYTGGQTWNMMLLTDNGDGPTAPETVQTFWDDVTVDVPEPRARQLAFAALGSLLLLSRLRRK